jgi:hypothetical protein
MTTQLADTLAAGPGAPPRGSQPQARCDLTSDGGEFTNATVDQSGHEQITAGDWTPVFAVFKLDAAEFDIVDDTVRMSTWQQSKRTDGGDRDIVQLYAYSARFRRKPKERLSDDEVAERRAAVRAWRLPRRIPGSGLGEPVAVVANLADIQGGKSEGGGVKATTDRLLNALENLHGYIERQRRAGMNLDEIVLVNNGDPMENCAGNYAAQLFTVELNHRGQMNFVLDMWELYARELFPRFDHGQFVSVLCNHGELARFGGAKNQTSDSDNAGGFLAETLKRILAGRTGFEHVEWTIPHDEMIVYPTIAGVPAAFTHGHKIPGDDAKNFEKWLNGQCRADERAHRAELWITAHRHHFAQWDMGSCTVLQCPSLDGGSKWLRDMTGRFSRTGLLALTVGRHNPLGWSDVAIL